MESEAESEWKEHGERESGARQRETDTRTLPNR